MIALVPGEAGRWPALKALAAHGATVGDWAGCVREVTRLMSPEAAGQSPDVVAEAAMRLLEAGWRPEVPAVPDGPLRPGQAWCRRCGQAGGSLASGPDGPVCGDTDDCEQEREARLPWFRRQWGESWGPTPGHTTGWAWVEKRPGGMGGSHYPPGYSSFPDYDEGVCADPTEDDFF